MIHDQFFDRIFRDLALLSSYVEMYEDDIISDTLDNIYLKLRFLQNYIYFFKEVIKNEEKDEER